MVAVCQGVAWLWVNTVFGCSSGTELMRFDFHEQMMTYCGKMFGGVPMSVMWENMLYVSSNGIMEGQWSNGRVFLNTSMGRTYVVDGWLCCRKSLGEHSTDSGVYRPSSLSMGVIIRQ